MDQLWPETMSKSFYGWAWMGNKNPDSGWVIDDDKIWSGYSSLEVWMPKVCVLFYVWVLFVCLQVCVFVICSWMEQQECLIFNDGTGSLLHDGWFLWGMWITSLEDNWCCGLWREEEWCWRKAIRGMMQMALGTGTERAKFFFSNWWNCIVLVFMCWEWLVEQLGKNAPLFDLCTILRIQSSVVLWTSRGL